ncbi:hypothetical protein [Microbacterium hydrocarbonoxydans]|uniref:hypothetical protein n=1 Tax=Microbacterium hydrocarbonoxydans TaxID=273678 RepID=UPI0020416993|nr:hypothetical protein [Microbacterium hydrocarbonoxydans]MCM3779853.1 hypothetical protein [Microbacterium hydrocarbonoxydans]
MRLRSLLVLGVAAALLLSGCAPEPSPEPTRTSSSPTPSPTVTPTVDPIVAPEAAFDVTCDDVAAEMAGLVGEPSTPVKPAMSTVSGMSWLPGPAEYMFQRASGIACSAGDAGRNWEITMVPDAVTVIAGASERQGYWGEVAQCSPGTCSFEFPDGDVLLSASIFDPSLGEGDVARVGEVLRRLSGAAAASVHDVEYIDSDLVGAPCERYATLEQVDAIVGADDARLITSFGGWGIPAEVYHVVNGSRMCYYATAEINGTSYLMITALPAGAWAFENQDGTPAEVEGAEAAKASVGAYGENILDVRVGVDWIRLVTYDNGSGAANPRPLAEQVIRNLTVGPTAPQ